MILLGVDTSSVTASAAVSQDERILGEIYLNRGLTHSQTSLVIIDSLLQALGIRPDEIDGFGVTIGPGSFTGLRIGLSLVKGMAFAGERPCAGISTLELLADTAAQEDALICPTLDARRAQVYTALFERRQGELHRLWEDTAISIEELGERLPKDRPVILTGDGSALSFGALKEKCPVLLADEARRYPRAGNLCLLSYRRLKEGKGIPAQQLVPSYLRLSQAERERMEKSML